MSSPLSPHGRHGCGWRRLGATVATLAAAACLDAAGPRTAATVTVSWLEWPAAVSAAAPGTLRVVGTRSQCGTFEIGVVQSGPSSVGVNAVEWIPDPPPPCLALDFLAIFDTVIALPRLTTPVGPTGFFSLDAVSWSSVGGTARRPFGTIDLALQPDTARRAAGRAHLLSDSLGCSWMRREIPGPTDVYPQVLANNVALGPNWVQVFTSGRFVTASSPRCGQTQLFQATSVEVEIP